MIPSNAEEDLRKDHELKLPIMTVPPDKLQDSTLKPQELSKHLFWDVDVNTLDAETSRRLIISRVLQFGVIEDWRQVRAYYGLSEIARVAATLRDLDPKSASFVALLADIPKEKFACFTEKQSTPTHWVC